MMTMQYAIPDYIDKAALVRKLYTDKKVRDGKLRMVFQKEIGDVMCFGDNDYAKQITEPEIAEVIDEMWKKACTDWNVQALILTFGTNF